MPKANPDLSQFSTLWFKGLSSEEKETLKSQLLSDKKTLDKLKEILYNISINEEEVRISDYDSPSWSHKQAHRNGYLDGIKTVIRLITIDKQ